jgi:transcriptional regulator with XRE-family HTH domain
VANLINRFRKARLIQGLTQTELADLLGVSIVTVSKWENGQSFPKAKRLNAVASVLHTTVSDLLNEAEEKEWKKNGAAS